MTHYYSLKTKKEELCLEPLVGGDYYFAVYDLKKNLIGEKVRVNKAEVIEFIWKKQAELKQEFEKIEVEEVEEVEEKKEVEVVKEEPKKKPKSKLLEAVEAGLKKEDDFSIEEVGFIPARKGIDGKPEVPDFMFNAEGEKVKIPEDVKNTLAKILGSGELKRKINSIKKVDADAEKMKAEIQDFIKKRKEGLDESEPTRRTKVPNDMQRLFDKAKSVFNSKRQIEGEDVSITERSEVREAYDPDVNPDEYEIRASVNVKTGDVNIKVLCSPPTKSVDETISNWKRIEKHLFTALVSSFPRFAEEYIIASARVQTGERYEDIVSAMKGRSAMNDAIRENIKKIVIDAIELYDKK